MRLARCRAWRWAVECVALTALVVGLGAAGAQGAPFVYVTNSGGGTVSQYDASGGALSPLAPPTVAAGLVPTGLAVSPDGKSAYVTNQSSNTVSQYSLDPRTGVLSPKTPATVGAGMGPSRVAVTPDGRSAYVANALGGTVSQYDIDPQSGALSPKIPATVAIGANPAAVAVTPDGKSAYVPNSLIDRFGIIRSKAVSQYNIDPVSGVLTPKTPATITTCCVPGDIAVTPDSKGAYVTNPGLLNSISQYEIDPVTGVLSPKIPATVATGAAPAAVAVTPDGKGAYVTNFNTNSPPGTVSQYDIDPVSGVLSPKTPATVASGTGPVGVAVAADGKSAYVTNFHDYTVSQFDIDPVTGVLSPKIPPTVATSADPVGIAVTPLPRAPTTKDQCKNGGWRNFPQFRNQGQCVAFVNQLSQP